MVKEKLIHNEPFEFEEWYWTINRKVYHIHKYRCIDCDEEAGYYYDYIILKVKDEQGKDLCYIKKYNRDNLMSFFCDPYAIFKEDLSQMLKLLKVKYSVKKFCYFIVGSGYQRIDKFKL
ncbi:hypothetical protein B0I26_11355 [Anoxybacillus vitaminiphilus]|uniref:Uncharacterized protein n=1 Tax=Paranoxybacillus vitaminiphilus TaxID=581036 RepID=A0A327Y9T0_9BACL|nr:hypothetical protein B0I26_11355 [Anoxybacillus vitaminiphilus]